MQKTILMMGAFDTKAVEFAFLRKQLLQLGCRIVTLNTGTLGSTDLFPVDIEAIETKFPPGSDRGEAMQKMFQRVASIVSEIYGEGRFDGIIGMGGGGGTSVIAAAMRALPFGVPKVCVSTVALGDVSEYTGIKDIVMFPSIVDVAGINSISQAVFARAAGAISGMVSLNLQGQQEDQPVIAASMFGNTTQCVDACRETLTGMGYEVIVFHATGTGGKTMESLVSEGKFNAVLDITTTELADTLCGGVFDAGIHRLDAPGKHSIPHLIAPGCVDMVNFFGPDSVPEHYRRRNLYRWNANVTLMRTNVDENRRLGKIFADKSNAAKGPVAFLLPLRGVSLLDGDGQPFCDREADAALFEAIKEQVKDDVPVHEVDANINDLPFIQKAVELILKLMARSGKE